MCYCTSVEEFCVMKYLVCVLAHAMRPPLHFHLFQSFLCKFFWNLHCSCEKDVSSAWFALDYRYSPQVLYYIHIKQLCNNFAYSQKSGAKILKTNSLLSTLSSLLSLLSLLSLYSLSTPTLSICQLSPSLSSLLCLSLHCPPVIRK